MKEVVFKSRPMDGELGIRLAGEIPGRVEEEDIMNRPSESVSSNTQRNMSKNAPSQVAAGASAQRSQSQQLSSGQSQSQRAQQDDNAESSQARGANAADSDEQIDPVCGMAVVTDELAEHYEHNGNTYYFCSSDCREQYEASPDDFEA
jgi:YHS domain-containing protein